ncbi:MAG: LLM class F420-dependent oxidoreductase [Actinobacteria bacterium]|nr:LLM class F420-dependent oxidoreductase [Actinomycetota bacterium]
MTARVPGDEPRLELGRFGVWATRTVWSPALAATLERLGYGTAWVGGADGNLDMVEQLLASTTRLRVATGIVNIWRYPSAAVASAYHRVARAYPGRFVLGIGAGHREAIGADYAKPYKALEGYLDALDAAGVPTNRRVLAALGPRVLRLSARRSAGAHPYLTTPEHTRRARDVLGEHVLLAPEQKVLLETDADRARELGRTVVPMYLRMANYVGNLRRLGYDDADLTPPGSDRLIDDLIAHGDADSVAAVLTAHLQAGADHVGIHVVGTDDPVPTLTELAGRLQN